MGIQVTILRANNITKSLSYKCTYVYKYFRFIEVLQNYTKNQMPAFMDIAFRAERSIEDELERESVSEAITVVISYILMFIYISLALGSFNSFRTMLVSI
jgi:Niemann-Pick C1 protein